MIEHAPSIIKPVVAVVAAGSAWLAAQFAENPLAEYGLLGIIVIALVYVIIALWRQNQDLRKSREKDRKQIIDLLQTELRNDIHHELLEMRRELREAVLESDQTNIATQPVMPKPRPLTPPENGYSSLEQKVEEIERQIAGDSQKD